jgi:hypothetical protein
MKNHIKFSCLILLSLHLTGCGFSTFTQRETDPFIRDIVGNSGKPVAIMVTDSSRRLVYEFKKSPNVQVICADAPPDTSIAASGAIGFDLSATIQGGAPNTGGNGALGFDRVTGASTIPLVRRSQGLQYARDLEAKECILFATGITTREQYLFNIKEIRQASKELIQLEIDKGLGSLSIGTTSNSSAAPLRKPK